MKISSYVMLSCIIVTFCASCSTPFGFSKYDYSVTIVNEGTDWIRMLPFEFTDIGKFDYALDAEVAPNGGSSGAGPYFKKPLNEVLLRWKNNRTGKESSAFIRVDLPKQFSPKNGSEIRFIIHSDEDRAEVKCMVQDPVSLDDYLVE